MNESERLRRRRWNRVKDILFVAGIILFCGAMIVITLAALLYPMFNPPGTDCTTDTQGVIHCVQTGAWWLRR
jgi:hypothetical protein